jgi:hypothetical protein
VRSARSIITLGALLAVLPLSGCITTRDRNGWAELRAKRVLAGREPSLVTVPNPDVVVSSVRAVRSKGAVAFVVALRNTSSRTLTDLPITVGVRRPGGATTYLNRRSDRDYFLNHVASVAPGAELSWVFSTERKADARGEPFALVGSPAQPPLSEARALPRVEVEQTGQEGGAVAVRTRSHTKITQFGLQLYAVASRDGQTVAAGRTTVDTLYADDNADATIPLIGQPEGATLAIVAVPTIFDK